MLEIEYDPMGRAISDYYSTGVADSLLVESDICETDEIPVSYLFRTFKAMPEIEQKALKLCRGEVLDVGAAAGSHSLWLQNNGIRTTAIDISLLSVETMMKRGIRNAKCCDFNTLSDNKKYDTLLILMNGAGLAGTLAGLGVFIQQCRWLLKPGGQVLIDSSDIIYLFDLPEEMPEYYYGEVEYQIFYKDVFSPHFNWLFVDFNSLKKEVEAQDMQCIRVKDGSNFDYLAKLTL